MTSKRNTVVDSIDNNLNKGQSKRSSFILRSAQILSKKLVFKKDIKTQSESDIKSISNNNNNNQSEIRDKILYPIESKTMSEKIVIKNLDKPVGDVKQIANYSDVVLELKQKFSSMTMINSIA